MRYLRTMFPGWPTLLLILLNAALLVAMATRLSQASPAQSILATTPQSVAAPTPWPEFVTASIDLSNVQDAALFHQSRSFYVPPAVPEVRTRPDYRLSATWRTPKQPPTAVLVQSQSGARTQVRPGADVEGWTVESIEPHVVILRHGEQRIEVRTARAVSGTGMRSASSPASKSPAINSGVRLLGSPR